MSNKGQVSPHTRSVRKQIWSWVKKAFAWGFIGCLLGSLAVLIAVYIEEVHHPQSHLARVGIEFLKHVGVALLVLGLVGIILDFDHWREYFQERLSEIVMKRSYLRTLEKSELVDLQTETLKAYFKDESIDRKDSFLHHFHSRIRDFIGSPYREDSHNSIVISTIESGDGHLVDDHLSYTCRKVGECIQPKVTWSLDLEEVLELQGLKFTLIIPAALYATPDFKTNYPGIDKRKTVIDQKDLKRVEGTQTYYYDLAKFGKIDELQVSIDAQYVIRKYSFFSWSLSLPSKGLGITIMYPPQLEVAVQTFGMNEEELDKDDKSGLYTMRYKPWLLPTSGLVLQLRPKSSKRPPESVTNEPVSKEAVDKEPITVNTPIQNGVSSPTTK